MIPPAARRANLRILHVAETAKGGVGTYLAELLPEQAATFGADAVRALVPARHAGHLAGVDRRLLKLWRRRGRSLRSLLVLARALRREIAVFRPDVIHAHSSFAGLLVRFLYGVRTRRPAIVYCPHGWGFDRTQRGAADRAAGWIERGLVSWCDAIVVISEHERRRAAAAGLDPTRLVLVLNGIADTRSPPPSRWEDERVRTLFVGRLDRQKGFDTLLDAVAPLERELSVRVIGSPVADARIDHRVLPHVQHLGWRSLSEVGAEIAAADVVVIPSRWEGFGLVALEAMRGGRAVVASDVGGLPEIVVDGVTGRLVPPDTPLALMQALSGETPARWRAMGDAGRERFLRYFSAARMATELAELYASLVARRSAAPSPEAAGSRAVRLTPGLLGADG